MTLSMRFTLCIITAAFVLTGCNDDSQTPQVTGPVEGKRLDGTETALKTSDTPAATDGAADKTPASTDTAADSKKKRDEWRDKKTGKPDENDPVAKANIELRPAIKETGATALTPVQRAALDALATAADKAAYSPEQRASAEQLMASISKVKLAPQEQASLDKIIAALEKAAAGSLVGPQTPNESFADPNNPNFIPADRNLYKKFDIAKLKSIDGYLAVPFADLSGFPYSGMVGAPEEEPATKDGKTDDTQKEPKYTIPDAIKALDKKKVVVKGYMMPIDFENGGTNEFVLTRNIPSCFYCQPPQLNDWVEVKMKDGKRVPYVPDGIIELYGTIDVGEMREDGFIVNLYRMEGEKVVEMKEE